MWNCRGFAFVSFASFEDCDRALESTKGASLNGRYIQISKARRNEAHEKTPGRCKYNVLDDVGLENSSRNSILDMGPTSASIRFRRDGGRDRMDDDRRRPRDDYRDGRDDYRRGGGSDDRYDDRYDYRSGRDYDDRRRAPEPERYAAPRYDSRDRYHDEHDRRGGAYPAHDSYPRREEYAG